MNKNKKIILSSLMLLGLLLLIVGVTYTALTYINKSDANTINIGSISMSYSEPSNALELINALPMSDEEGINQTNYFEFTVSSNATTNANDDIGVTIPYEINISDIEIDNDKTILPKDKIKVVLTKVNDGLEEKVIEPTIVSTLSNSTLNTGSLKVYDTKNVHKNNNGTITTRYRLRAWIDKGFELDNTNTYQYKFRVNVNSQVGVLEQPKPTLKELILGENNSNVLTSGDTGLFATNDTNDGKISYYYKGNVTNNYVRLPEKSGDMTTDALYRIVRVNTDGSVRLIRNDSIGTNAFKPNDDNDNYNYMYYSNSNVENGIMKRVNDWYTSAIEETTLDKKIVESTFCEQAKIIHNKYYTSGNAEMVIASKDYRPSLKCEEDGNGKGPLRMKVGLITEDEVMFAGIPLHYDGITSTEYNKNTYLDMGSDIWYFWTMSPAGFRNNDAYAWYVNSSGSVSSYYVNFIGSHVRPVFSLTADVLISGKGTIFEPFEPVL